MHSYSILFLSCNFALQMYKHNRTDFIETNLKSALVDSYDHQMESLQSMQEEFDRHRKRLNVVREEKEKARLEFQGKKKPLLLLEQWAWKK